MIYSKYIRDLGEKTKIPLRTVEAEWKIAEKKLNYDTMLSPNKYSHLKKMDGTYAEEIARRVEKSLLQPATASEEEKEVIPGNTAEEVATTAVNTVESQPTEEPPVEQIENSNMELPTDTIPEKASDFSEDTKEVENTGTEEVVPPIEEVEVKETEKTEEVKEEPK